MKSFQTLLMHARGSLRSARARVGLPTPPASLHLRLDALDAPPGLDHTHARTLDDVQRDIAAWVRTFGPTRVHVVARADHPLLTETMRFAHRLECTVHLRTCARGLNVDIAGALLETSPAVVRIRVAGTDDAVQASVLGERVADAESAVEHLLTMRTLLRRAEGARSACAVRVAWVPTEAGATQLRGIFDLARRAALDGVDIEAPWTPGPPGPALRAALEWARQQHAPFHGTPRRTIDALLEGGAGGHDRRCAVGGTRLEVRPDGTVTHCPVACAPAPGMTDTAQSHVAGDVAVALAALAPQRTRVRVCDRACVHPDVLGDA